MKSTRATRHPLAFSLRVVLTLSSQTLQGFLKQNQQLSMLDAVEQDVAAFDGFTTIPEPAFRRLFCLIGAFVRNPLLLPTVVLFFGEGVRRTNLSK
jgi:hypothetical protein